VEYTPHDLTSLVLAVAPCTGKIIKNGLSVFERGETFLQNGILHFVFRLSQLSEICVGMSEFMQTKNKSLSHL